jgi:hypothetical protein
MIAKNTSKNNKQNLILNSSTILLCKDISHFKLLLKSSNFIIDTDRDHSHFDYLFSGLINEHQLYSSALKDPTLSLEDKQERLNNLHLSFTKDLNSIQFYVPKSLHNWIAFIDSVSLINDSNLLKHSHLIYLWNKSQGIDCKKPVIYSLRTTEKSTFLNKLIFVFKIANFLKHSIGLMLAHCISKSAFKAVTQFSNLGHSSFHLNSKGKRVLNQFDFSEDTYLEIEKIKLLSSTGKEFLTQIPSLLKLAKNKILSKIRLKGIDSLSTTEKDLHTQLEVASNEWFTSDDEQALFCEQLGIYFDFQTDLFYSTMKPIVGTIKHTNVYVLSPDFIKALFVLGRESFQLPHLLPLDNWVHSRKDLSSIDQINPNSPKSFTIHSGGPTHLSSPMVSAFIKSKHNSFGFAKEIDLEALNYMKNQRFKINKEFLNHIFSYLPHYLMAFLYQIHPNPDDSNYPTHKREKDIHLLNHGILAYKQDHNGDCCSLRTLGEFLNLDHNLNTLIAAFSKEPEGTSQKEDLSNRIFYIKKELIKAYLDALILLRTFFHTLLTASSFSDLSFFLNVNVDFRGRFYYLAFPLGVQNSNLGSSLFELDFNHPVSTSFDNTRLFHTYVSGLKPLKDFFTINKFKLKMNSSTIGLDVTCSGLQIISALIGFEDGLLLTNLIHDPSAEDKKLDLYGNIRQAFFNVIPTNLTSKELNIKNNEVDNPTELETEDIHSSCSDTVEDDFLKRTMARTRTINSQNKTKSSDNLILFISNNKNAIRDILIAFKNILDRNVIKYWAMRLVYSEGSRSRAVELMTFYNDQANNFPKGAPRKLIFKIAMFLADLFKNVMFTQYTGFGDFVNFCQKHIVSKNNLEANKGVWLTCSAIHLEVFFTQFKHLSKRYYHNDRLNNIVSFSYNNRSDKIDYAGHSRSLLPNFIHFLDSRLMTLIILNCKEKNIPIYGNHDCFYVPISFGEDIKHIYFSCFKELFFNHDCLAYFFESNCISPDTYNPFLSQINERKKAILSKLDLKTLSPSFFILS